MAIQIWMASGSFVYNFIWKVVQVSFHVVHVFLETTKWGGTKEGDEVHIKAILLPSVINN